MNRVREVRRRIDKTQLELMKNSGIHFSTISQIERGWLVPSDKQKQKLARALNEPVDWLFPKNHKNENY